MIFRKVSFIGLAKNFGYKLMYSFTEASKLFVSGAEIIIHSTLFAIPISKKTNPAIKKNFLLMVYLKSYLTSFINSLIFTRCFSLTGHTGRRK